MNDQLSLHAILTTKINFVCVQNLKHTVYYIMVVIFVSYHFIVSSCILWSTSTFQIFWRYLIVIWWPHCNRHSPYTTILGTDNRLCQWSWCCACVHFEMVIAQTPNRMRGIMMGVVIVMLGFDSLYNAKTFQQLQAASPSCVFYYYLVLSLLLLLILIVFVILAKRYKLKRGRNINIQAIVEEHYERYFMTFRRKYLKTAQYN